MEALLHPIPEAADRLGVGRTTIYRLITDGTLKTVTIGNRRLVPAAELEAYVERLSAGAA